MSKAKGENRPVRSRHSPYTHTFVQRRYDNVEKLTFNPTMAWGYWGGCYQLPGQFPAFLWTGDFSSGYSQALQDEEVNEPLSQRCSFHAHQRLQR